MFIINIIYKINKYKLFLFIITNINALKNLFYIIFYFLTQKKNKNYLYNKYYLIAIFKIFN